MRKTEHRRLILHDFVTLDDCKELEFIHKSCCTVGYRPNLLSTTLSHLIATNCPHLILPFVPIREKLKEKVEEFFGCEYELCIEFTGLISWLKGASIGWHSDDGRPYLKQRSFTAVCYLNTYGEDFKGGLFHFQDGEPKTIIPSAGDVAIYTADSCNTHSVDEVTDGERLTLTLWFSRDNNHDEDAKLISLLSQRIVDDSLNMPNLCLPLPASINMYWFSPDQDFEHHSGFNICCARMHVLGFDIYVSPAGNCLTDFLDTLMEPLQLVRGEELFQQEFVNILHALQVLQFYFLKAPLFQTSKAKAATGKVVPLSQLQWEKISCLRSLFIKDYQVAERVLNYVTRESDGQHHFDWAIFSAAIAAWEAYTGKLYNELLMSLPYWRTNQSIYSVSFEES